MLKFIDKHSLTIGLVLIFLIISGIFVIVFEKKFVNKYFSDNKVSENTTAIDEKIKNLDERISKLEDSGSKVVVSESSPNVSASELININLSDAKTLDKLPGIGEVKSKAIVDYRTSNGQFTSLESLKNVPGISSGVYDKLKDLITL